MIEKLSRDIGLCSHGEIKNLWCGFFQPKEHTMCRSLSFCVNRRCSNEKPFPLTENDMLKITFALQFLPSKAVLMIQYCSLVTSHQKSEMKKDRNSLKSKSFPWTNTWQKDNRLKYIVSGRKWVNVKQRKRSTIKFLLKPENKHEMVRRNRQKHTGEKSTWKFYAEKQKGKFSDELAQIVLWLVSAFARNMPNPTCRSSKEENKVFLLHYFLMEYSWEPCSMFSMECAVFPKVVSWYNFLSPVASFSGRRTYSFYSVEKYRFRENHSQFTCRVYNI